MVRVQEGELDQLGLLFERYNRMLFAFFYGQNRNTALSNDLVQNVFLRILKYRQRFRGDGDFKAWLFHIARNVHYDHHQKYKNRQTEQIDDWQDQLVDQKRSQTQEMIRAEELKQLRQALQQLPDEQQQVLELGKLQGLAYKDIAQILGCTEGAVKVKVFRALKALKKIYGNG